MDELADSVDQLNPVQLRHPRYLRRVQSRSEPSHAVQDSECDGNAASNQPSAVEEPTAPVCTRRSMALEQISDMSIGSSTCICATSQRRGGSVTNSQAQHERIVSGPGTAVEQTNQ